MNIIARINAYCFSHGVRYSDKRNQVALVLERTQRAMDAEQIWLHMKEEQFTMSIGAVYLSLNWLVEAGFIEKKLMEDRKAVFAVL